MILHHCDGGICHVNSTRAQRLFEFLIEKKSNEARLAHAVLSDDVDENASDFDRSLVR